ncbi:MaoC family dehydratase N-terminal domain-containing protein [Chloroflexota bacterium]
MTRQPDEKKMSSAEIVAKLSEGIGIERPMRQFYDEASKDAIRHYAEGFGDDNPLWQDEEYASKTRWGRIIAPPLFPQTLQGGPVGRIERPKTGSLHFLRPLDGGTEFTFFQPVYVGDKMTGMYGMAEVLCKESREGGENIFSIEEHKCINQNNEIACKWRKTFIARWPPPIGGKIGRNMSKYEGYSKPRYSQEELQVIEQDIEKEELRGAQPRFWEDVNVGDNLTPLVKGPLTLTDMVTFSMGYGGPFMMANEIAYKFMRRHPKAATYDAKTNVPELDERWHFDDAFAIQKGMPSAYDLGPQRMAWMAQVVTNWMSDEGFMRKFSVRLRRLNFLGDTAWCKGQVIEKYVQDNKHLVKIDLWGVNQRDEKLVEAWSEVQLPTRKKEGGA